MTDLKSWRSERCCVDLKIVFLLIVFLLVIWRIKKGFKNGIVKEIINILSIIVSCVSITLIFLSVSSVMAHTFSTLTVCIIGLIGIGVIFKICHLILRPIMGIMNISIINGLNKILGAVMGFGEALICSYFLYRVIDYFGIYIV